MIVTQDEYDVAKQRNRRLYIKIDLLNYNFQTVDELSGTVVGNPTFTINADSDIRRTCSFSLVPTDISFDIKEGSKIWMDKYVKVFIGIYNNKTKNITYSNQGMYIINNPNINYSAINHIINIQGVDMMAMLNGVRGGNITSITDDLGSSDIVNTLVNIPKGSNVRQQIIDLMKACNIKKYNISEFPITTPYEIKIAKGSTAYDILNEFIKILPNYQMYFDVEGVFHFQPIPSGKDEEIFIDDDIWTNNLVDYNKNIDFTQIKNVVEVYGKTHDVSNFADENHVTILNNIYKLNIPTAREVRDYLKIGFMTNTALKAPSIVLTTENYAEGEAVKIISDTYNLKIPSVIDVKNNIKIGFMTSTALNNPKIKINDNKQAFPIFKSDGKTPPIFKNTLNYYVVRFKESAGSTTENKQGYFELIGYEDDVFPILEEDGKTPVVLENKNNKTQYYVVRFKELSTSTNTNKKGYFEFMGNIQPRAVAKEINPDSPFYIGGELGEIAITLEGGEYDNINTNALAQERANWELYSRCKLKDSITLNCLPIYWIDVNKVVKITLPNKKGTLETNEYIIKTVNTNFGINGMQSIECMRYYPFYSDYIKNIKG